MGGTLVQQPHQAGLAGLPIDRKGLRGARRGPAGPHGPACAPLQAADWYREELTTASGTPSFTHRQGPSDLRDFAASHAKVSDKAWPQEPRWRRAWQTS